MFATIRRGDMRRPDARLDFCRLGPHGIARQRLGMKGDLEIDRAARRRRHGLKQPLDIMDVVHVAIEVDVAAPGRKRLRGRRAVTVPAKTRKRRVAQNRRMLVVRLREDARRHGDNLAGGKVNDHPLARRNADLLRADALSAPCHEGFAIIASRSTLSMPSESSPFTEYSSPECRQGLSLPSAVRRMRLHSPQKWALTGLMRPMFPLAPGRR